MMKRRNFPKQFRRQVAVSVDREHKNFMDVANKYNISVKQAKGYWLEYQAELNEEYLVEIKTLRQTIKLLEARILELE